MREKYTIENDPESDHSFSSVLCTHYGEKHQTEKE